MRVIETPQRLAPFQVSYELC